MLAHTPMQHHATQRRPFHAIHRRLALAITATAIALAGCATETPPRFTVTEARLSKSSPTASVVTFTVRGDNKNEFELPLRAVDYTVRVRGRTVFTGQREAQATLPRFGSQTFQLPAAITHADLADLAQTPDADISGNWLLGKPATLSGRVTYETAGSIAEVLFDTKLRVPRQRFNGNPAVTAANQPTNDDSSPRTRTAPTHPR
jgi:hypothetical protein